MGSNEAVIAAGESVWLDANRFYEAESRYIEVSMAELRRRANPGSPPQTSLGSSSGTPPSANTTGMSQSSLASEIAHARQRIQNFLKSAQDEFANAAARFDLAFGGEEVLDGSFTSDDFHLFSSDESDSSGGDSCSLSVEDHFKKLQTGQERLQQKMCEFESDYTRIFDKISALEKSMDRVLSRLSTVENTVKGSGGGIQNGSSRPADDDDLDLFGSDEEVDDNAAKVREERLQAYANKKAKKPALVAKSSVVLDVKPWDDETDLKAMEKSVRGIETDGLVWGASKLVPLAYGIKKLQIVAVVEDEKVSIDWLQEVICEMEDLVQSVDVAAFNKL